LKKAIILSLVVLTACTSLFKKKSERALARVNDDYLYESELKGVIPPGTAPRDSASLAQNFIDYWIRQRLILQNAEKNLSPDKTDFTRQMEEYKNSLIIYAYENELVKQKLDTLVQDEEIEQYYDANQANFQLKDNIVRVQYIKVPLRSANKIQLKKLLMSDDSRDKTLLSELCEKNAADYYLDDNNWLVFNDLLAQVPIKTYNQEEFLRNHRELEYQDSLYTYLVRFKDFKIKESISPLSFEKDRIRNIILNKRKIDMINKMHQDIYERAQKKNEIEIY
jgi:hypothetical protein